MDCSGASASSRCHAGWVQPFGKGLDQIGIGPLQVVVPLRVPEQAVEYTVADLERRGIRQPGHRDVVGAAFVQLAEVGREDLFPGDIRFVVGDELQPSGMDHGIVTGAPDLEARPGRDGRHVFEPAGYRRVFLRRPRVADLVHLDLRVLALLVAGRELDVVEPDFQRVIVGGVELERPQGVQLEGASRWNQAGKRHRHVLPAGGDAARQDVGDRSACMISPSRSAVHSRCARMRDRPARTRRLHHPRCP